MRVTVDDGQGTRDKWRGGGRDAADRDQRGTSQSLGPPGPVIIVGCHSETGAGTLATKEAFGEPFVNSTNSTALDKWLCFKCKIQTLQILF